MIEKSPKSRRSWRVLPFEPVTSALAALQAVQMGELDAADKAYANTGYVAADELGKPLRPERYSDEFGRLCRETGLPKIRLHDTRGTMNGILERDGVPETPRQSGRRPSRSRGPPETRRNQSTRPGDLLRILR